MSANTKHSVGLLIVNDVPDSKAIIERIKTDLYTMNMLVSVLHNSNADDVKNAVDKLTKLKPSLVEEIIVVIHTRRQPDMENRHFECKGQIMDVHDILDQLLKVYKFEDKFKLVIVAGPMSETRLAIINTKKAPYFHRSRNMVCILFSKNEKFITTTISELVNRKGDISDVLNSKNIKDLHYNIETTASIPLIKIWKSQFIS